MKLLLDENLSPSLVKRLAGQGVPAAHAAYVGLSGATDPVVWRYAFAHDQIVVTANAADFLRLAEGGELHAGLVVLRAGALSRDDQWAWLEPVVDRLRGLQGGLVNRAVIVTGAGRFTIVDLPPAK